MNNFQAWWKFCQIYDGSAADGPGTRWGWTYPTWCDATRYSGGQDISQAAFQAMTQDAAGALALGYFWDRLGGPALNAGNDLSFVDWCWTSGGATIEVQTHLAVGVDGIVGPITIAAINGNKNFLQDCHDWRVAYYNMLGYQTVYPGLYTRANNALTLAKTL